MTTSTTRQPAAVRTLAARATLALGLCITLAAATTSPPVLGTPPAKATKHHPAKKTAAKKPVSKTMAVKKTAVKKPVSAPSAVKPPAPVPAPDPAKDAPPVVAVPSAEGTAALVAQGKTLATAKNCNGCHGADLSGKAGGPPSLHVSGITSKYNAQTWARMLDTGDTPDGGKVHPPMPVYHLSADDSAALWAYVNTLP